MSRGDFLSPTSVHFPFDFPSNDRDCATHGACSHSFFFLPFFLGRSLDFTPPHSIFFYLRRFTIYARFSLPSTMTERESGGDLARRCVVPFRSFKTRLYDYSREREKRRSTARFFNQPIFLAGTACVANGSIFENVATTINTSTLFTTGSKLRKMLANEYHIYMYKVCRRNFALLRVVRS